ncbi:MAG: cytochrome c peroxidase [Gammaproteobacteria bacterium]
MKSDPENRDSAVVFDTDDVASSPGSFRRDFVAISPGNAETTARVADDIFHVNGTNVRQLPPRNAPTVINAVFFYRNFWDGRANAVFNGVDPFGRRNRAAFVLRERRTGDVVKSKVRLDNASLASQAVGPVLSDLEMSCRGRIFKRVGQKLLDSHLQPLALQQVDATDSALAAYVDASDGKGLATTYGALVQKAFQPPWWRSTKRFDVDGNIVAGAVTSEAAVEDENEAITGETLDAVTATMEGDVITEGAAAAPRETFSQMEFNFSLFLGLAIQLYESTLVSDQTPFDRFAGDRGNLPDANALTSQQQEGLGVFMNQGHCVNCHKTAMFSGASTLNLLPEAQEGGLIERMLMGDETRGPAFYDNGFYNIGTRPTQTDLGVGGIDPFGNPLSFTRQYLSGQRRDVFDVNPCSFAIRVTKESAGDLNGDGLDDPFPATTRFRSVTCKDGTTALEPIAPRNLLNRLRSAVNGAFKTPSLRNVELTGPYFHSGGKASLEEVVEFYNRGGDFAQDNQRDLDPDIEPLGLSESQRAALVAFLKGLTDERVRWEQAPFDHPQLFIPNGHLGDENAVQDADGNGEADDERREIPAVGAQGRKAKGLPPLQGFVAGLRP